MKKIITVFGILLLSILLVSANEVHQESFEEGRKLVDSGINCDKLTDEQLEVMGDYYMEQMHPGESHELMDEMMGGEGSESLKQVHIQMARNIYCGESGNMVGGGMMNMMMGNNMMGSGITGNYYNSYNVFGWIFMVLVIIVLSLLIIWLVKQIQSSGRGRRKRK